MESEYEFKFGYRTDETIQRAYDDADLNCAIRAYKLLYPTVSFSTGYENQRALSLEANHQAAMISGSRRQLAYTPNSDTLFACAYRSKCWANHD